MSIGDVLFILPRHVKKTIRQIETTQRKLVKAQAALVFNETAIKEELLPNYTKIKTHDPATRERPFTKEYRKKLVEHEIEQKKKLIGELEEKLNAHKNEFEKCFIDDKTRQDVQEHLELSAQNAQHANTIKTVKKLTKLYGGPVTVSEANDGYVNLSSITLTDTQKQLLNLGLNCQYQCKYDPLDKKAEMELLYRDILKLQSEKKVEVNPNLRDRLAGESSRVRDRCKSKIISRALFRAAKELREDDRVTIRRADKSSVYVIMNKEDYQEKMDNILNDETKFEKIKKDPTDTLKARVNRLLAAANAVVGGVHFSKITGEYAPGYAYGNVKLHKSNHPLRPIISQIPTPTYRLAKRLNELLQPYIPTGCSLRSVDEFLDILRTNKPKGILASIDVESLFTNVPVETTIQIILDRVYHTDNIEPLKLPKAVLEQLLRACTTESPFRGPNGQLYTQKEGVAMGSPLGPLFANFYMTALEDKILSDPQVAPNLYCRYVDDVFVDVRNVEHLHQIIQAMETNSVLKFTYELSIENKIPFLDVMVHGGRDKFSTTVYRKTTDAGKCLNADSECPDRYKKSVIKSFIRRAMKHCSSWSDLDSEFTRIKQILVNNGYSNSEVDSEIRLFLNKHQNYKSNTAGEKKKKGIVLYYRNHMSPAHKVDERVLRDIVYENVKCAKSDDKLELVVYYRNRKTQQLLLKNNPYKKDNILKRSNVVYQFYCPYEDCRLHSVSYIGVTTTTLSRRLTMHLREGSPKEHMHRHHNTTLTREQLVDNTIIIDSADCQTRLHILEALHIKDKAPSINKQIASSAVTLALWGGGGAVT